MTHLTIKAHQTLTEAEEDALRKVEHLFSTADRHAIDFTNAAALCVFVEEQNKAHEAQRHEQSNNARADMEAAREFMATKAAARAESRMFKSWMTLAIDGGILHAYHFRCAIEAISRRYRADLASLHTKVSADLIDSVLGQFDEAFPHTVELRNAVGHVVELSATDAERKRHSIDRERRIYMQQLWSPPFGVTYFKAPKRSQDPSVAMEISVSPSSAAQMQSVLNQLRTVLTPLTDRL